MWTKLHAAQNPQTRMANRGCGISETLPNLRQKIVIRRLTIIDLYYELIHTYEGRKWQEDLPNLFGDIFFKFFPFNMTTNYFFFCGNEFGLIWWNNATCTWGKVSGDTKNTKLCWGITVGSTVVFPKSSNLSEEATRLHSHLPLHALFKTVLSSVRFS